MEPRKKAPRDVVVRFRCTAQDKAELEKAASELGEDLSSWARRVLLAESLKVATWSPRQESPGGHPKPRA